jgi:hypothetical protein
MKPTQTTDSMRKQIAALKEENRELRKQLAQLDEESRKDRAWLGAALVTLEDRNAEIERIRVAAKSDKKRKKQV